MGTNNASIEKKKTIFKIIIDVLRLTFNNPVIISFQSIGK